MSTWSEKIREAFDAGWNESEHPREGGKFAEKGGGTGGTEGSGNPNESVQERSWREWTENFNRVSADPEAASEKDLRRAYGYLDHRLNSILRNARESGRKVDPNVLAGYNNELEHYKGILMKRER